MRLNGGAFLECFFSFRAGLFAAFFSFCILISVLVFRSQEVLSPCEQKSFCLWSVWAQPGSQAFVRSRVSFDVQKKALQPLLESMDALHGAMWGSEEDSDEDAFVAPEEEDADNSIFSKGQELVQDAVDALWNDGGVSMRGVLALQLTLLGRARLLLARLFLGDDEYLESFVAMLFPRLNDTVDGIFVSDISKYDVLKSGVHHALVQFSVADLFWIYDELCFGEPFGSVCQWLNKSTVHLGALFETTERIAGSDAVINMHFYWKIQKGLLLWANTSDAFEAPIAFESSQEMDEMEKAVVNSDALFAHGFLVRTQNLQKMWSDVRSTVELLYSENEERRGFLGFPDLLERFDRLSQWVLPLLGNHDFALGMAAGTQSFSASAFVRNDFSQEPESMQQLNSSTEKPEALSGVTSVLKGILGSWSDVLLQDLAIPSENKVIFEYATGIDGRSREGQKNVNSYGWNRAFWKAPLAALPVSALWRIAETYSSEPLAFD